MQIRQRPLLLLLTRRPKPHPENFTEQFFKQEPQCGCARHRGWLRMSGLPEEPFRFEKRILNSSDGNHDWETQTGAKRRQQRMSYRKFGKVGNPRFGRASFFSDSTGDVSMDAEHPLRPQPFDLRLLSRVLRAPHRRIILTNNKLQIASRQRIEVFDFVNQQWCVQSRPVSERSTRCESRL